MSAPTDTKAPARRKPTREGIEIAHGGGCGREDCTYTDMGLSYACATCMMVGVRPLDEATP